VLRPTLFAVLRSTLCAEADTLYEGRYVLLCGGRHFMLRTTLFAMLRPIDYAEDDTLC
jgi:hypothetical protein